LDLDDIQKTKETCKEIQEHIRCIRFDEHDADTILKFFDELNCRYVAVRSSGTAEDLPNAAFAGQHDTYLYVDKAKLLDRIIECYSSLYSTRAVYYRDMKGIGQDVAIAVVIQEMVPSDMSGVMYTKNPTTGADEIIIEVSHGLGEMVVSGKVDPDRIHIIGGDVDYKVGTKDKMMTLSGITDNPKCDMHALNDPEVQELVKYAGLLEEYFNAPQDIEFAYHDGKLFILQSRNLTTIKKIKK